MAAAAGTSWFGVYTCRRSVVSVVQITDERNKSYLRLRHNHGMLYPRTGDLYSDPGVWRMWNGWECQYNCRNLLLGADSVRVSQVMVMCWTDKLRSVTCPHFVVS